MNKFEADTIEEEKQKKGVIIHTLIYTPILRDLIFSTLNSAK